MVSRFIHLKFWRIFLAFGFICMFATTLSTSQAAPAALNEDAGIGFWLGPYLDIWMGDIHPSHDPAIAYNSLHDEFLVVWVVDREDSTYDLWARRVKTDGSMPSYFRLLSRQDILLDRPSVAYNPVQDEYLVVFEHAKLSADLSYDVYGIRLSWDGEMISSMFSINYSVLSQEHPSIAYNSQQNQYLVAYHEQQEDSRVNIKLVLLDHEGVQMGYGEILSLLNEKRIDPEVVYNLAHNQYLVVFTFVSMSPPISRIKGRVVNPDLTDIIASPEYFMDNPTIGKINAQAASGIDEYLVTWSRIDNGVDYDIYGRRLNGNGVPQVEDFPIATEILEMHPEGDIAFRPGIGYLTVSLYSSSTANLADIYLRFIKPDQNQASGPEYALDNSPGLQEQPAIACNPKGSCLVTYTYKPESSTVNGIRGRIIGFVKVFLPMLRQ